MERRRTVRSAVPRLGLGICLAGLLWAVGCQDKPNPQLIQPLHQGPILLITLEGLRFDAVTSLGGEPGLTPNLDRLVADATWAGAGVAPSSWLLPSMASLMTGLRPVQHGAVSGQEKELSSDLLTLAEALTDHGYRCRAYHDTPGLAAAYGFAQGFESLTAFRRGQRAELDLATLSGGPELVWVHLGLPSPPFTKREIFTPQLPPAPAGLPRRVGGTLLERYFDPAVPLPAADREKLWALYRYNVAAADAYLGQMLQALSSSPHGKDALVVVVSAYGQEFGEHQQIGQGGHLGRELIEVPLVIRFPERLRSTWTAQPGERLATRGLWATLVEAAGGKAPPGVAPSLFRPAGRGILSELMLIGGRNEISWLEGNLQLRWQARFAEDGGDFYRLRLAAIGGGPANPSRLAFRNRMTELHPPFHETPKLGAPGATPSWILERWGERGSHIIEDPTTARTLAERLREAFSTFEKDQPW